MANKNKKLINKPEDVNKEPNLATELDESLMDEIDLDDEVKLTDEQVQVIKNLTSDIKSEDAKFLESLPSNNGILENQNNNNNETFVETANVIIDPNTGALNVLERELDERMAKLLDVNIEDLYKLPTSAAEIPYDPELVKSNAKEYGIKDEDIMAILPLIDKMRAGEDLNWYNEMPQSIKNMINKQCLELNNNTLGVKKLLAEELLKGLIRDAGIDKLVIDLQEVTNKALDISGLMKMTLDYQSTLLETEFKKIADKYEAEGKTEKAEKMRAVTEAYKQSYTLEDFIAKAKAGKIRVKDFDLTKYKRFVSLFNHKYETDTPFVINDISGIAPVLKRKFPEFTTDQIMRFVIGICKYCQNMDSKDVVDHTFMSYTIININNLDLIIRDQEENAFVNTLMDSLRKAIKAVNNIKEEE